MYVRTYVAKKSVKIMAAYMYLVYTWYVRNWSSPPEKPQTTGVQPVLSTAVSRKNIGS